MNIMDRKRIPAVGNILFLIHSSFSLILTIMLKKKKNTHTKQEALVVKDWKMLHRADPSCLISQEALK